MRQVLLRSSSLAWIAYDDGNERLFVGFQNGTSYRYDGVPSGVVMAILFDSVSHGRAFDAKIRNGVYPFHKIDPSDYNLHV